MYEREMIYKANGQGLTFILRNGVEHLHKKNEALNSDLKVYNSKHGSRELKEIEEEIFHLKQKLYLKNKI